MFLLNLLLALAWLALSGEFTPANFVAGFALGYVVLRFGVSKTSASKYFSRLGIIIGFVVVFLWELIQASVRVAIDIVTPQHYMKPGVIAVPLDALSDEQITLLSSVITLTPGSLTLDLSDDRRLLFVHEMYVPDIERARNKIKCKLEARVLRMMQ